MNNHIFDNFDRTEFSDQIFAIFGRALTVATCFDASTKTLARLPLFEISILAKHTLDDDAYEKMVKKVSNKYKNLNQAIESFQCDEDIEKILHQARESRNELIHEATLGALNGFDHIGSLELFNFLNHIETLVLKIIKGEALISTITTIHNKEPVTDYPFSKEYENKYVAWVMERFENNG
jgi:hypothetical protein